MPKFSVYALYTASRHIGEFVAETADEAEVLADKEGDFSVSICHQCSREIDIGDCYKTEVEEITE